jgi:glycosyltransferase involved in cell wall biosynthesis
MDVLLKALFSGHCVIILLALKFLTTTKIDYYVTFAGNSLPFLHARLAKLIFKCRIIIEEGSTHAEYRRTIRHIAHEYNSSAQLAKFINNVQLAIYRADYDSADLLYVPSNFVGNTFTSVGYDASKLRIVPYSVDRSLFYPDHLRDYSKKREFRVAFFGTFNARKGAREIIEYLGSSLFLGCHWLRIEIIGPMDTSTGRGLEDVVARHSLSARVFITGPVSKKVAGNILRCRVDAFILPSHEEGLPLAALQAIACGLPVIVSRESGIPDLFYYNGVPDGLVVLERISASAISDSITTLFGDLNYFRRLRMASISLADSFLTDEAYRRRYIDATK